MNKTLRVLVIEDSERDVQLLRRQLSRADYELTFHWVETPAAMKEALDAHIWDVILSDYSMPGFSALAALELLKETNLDIPFIVISGTIGEELAVETMLAGAHDYLMKGNFSRLIPAIERERQEAANRLARRQAEESLRTSEAELRALFAAMTDVILEFDIDGCLLKTAPTNTAHLHTPGHQKISSSICDIFSQEQVDSFLCLIRGVLNEGQMRKIEYRLEGDGKEVWFETSISPMTAESVIWIARDITERKQAEEEKARLINQIESQRQRLENIVTNVPGVVWEAWGEPDASTQRINYVSDYVETMLGYSMEEWLATPNFWLTIVHVDDREWAARDTAESFANGRPGRFEFRWIAKDQRVVWVESRTVVVTDHEGRPIGLRGVTIDINERKKVEETLRQREEQLHHAQKLEAIGTLAGGIAHDFNNVLGIIMGYCELGQWNLPPEHVTQPYLAEVLKASHHARDLIQQILTFSRQKEHGRRPIRLQPVLEETLNLLRATIPTTVEICQHLDPEAPAILGDPTQIHQVMMNLGTNAWQAMSKHGGILKVSLAPIDINADSAKQHADLHEGKYLSLIVSDTGEGMNQATIDRIYEPFFTTKAPGEGTGLGLAVVHGVVKKHEGTIMVESEPEKGTSFNLYFPVYEGDELSSSLINEPFPGHLPGTGPAVD
ncbi:MAG TPA: PAS domain-containing protein, partial [Blastocatellia bacterium]|nr:PAS domain-containing protein [Blastocatellia bacterium]